jgi:hypothetical protein
MKKLIAAIMMVFGINFLLLAGGAGYLFKTGKLDKQKALAIKELVFPASVAEATTQPSDEATTKPVNPLEELLARKIGMTAGEQVAFLQQRFDAQSVQLDQRRRELEDLQRQIDFAKQQVARDRKAVDADRAKLTAEQALAEKMQNDKGFQDSLALYQVLPGKQVKEIFKSLSDETIVRYLEAMDPSASKKILREYKSPEEVARVQTIMEKMRQPEASAKE